MPRANRAPSRPKKTRILIKGPVNDPSCPYRRPADPGLSVDFFALGGVQLPLSAHLLRLRTGSFGKARGHQGQLAGRQAHCPLQPLGILWL